MSIEKNFCLNLRNKLSSESTKNFLNFKRSSFFIKVDLPNKGFSTDDNSKSPRTSFNESLPRLTKKSSNEWQGYRDEVVMKVGVEEESCALLASLVKNEKVVEVIREDLNLNFPVKLLF